jgi:O-antigen ligase
LISSRAADKKRDLWAIIIVTLYVIVNSLLISKEVYWFSVLPGVLLISMIYIFALDKIYLIIAFFTPIAIDIKEIGIVKGDIGLSIPTEPLLFALMFFFIVKLIFDRHFDRRIFRHPVSLALYFYLIWMFLTSITSEFPLVSFKFFLARLWFVIPIYFFGVMVFKNYRNIPRFIWMYVISLVIVIGWTISQHALNGFTEHAAHWVMSPFYNDHTSYGAVLAMFIPVLFGLLYYYQKTSQKVFTALVLIIYLVAIYLSISRAAWASIVVALGVFILIRFKIRLSWVLTAFAILLFFVFSFQEQILMKLEKNKQDSSSDFIEHVQSMSNIATDASNLERINRWMSAIRMFEARPVFGWGPGTYQFVYAPFQSVEQKTVISTNAGNKGTAHSEYLLALSEQGLIGMLNFIIVMVLVSLTALRNYRNIENRQLRILSLIIFLGLITYIAHAFFNNFLDTDKMSVPFWGFIAAIVAIDIYYKGQSKALEADNAA